MPHPFVAPEQVAVHVTPAPGAPFTVLVMVAVTFATDTPAPPLMVSVGGGAGALKLIRMASPALIVTLAAAIFAGLAAELAWIVTEPPCGTVVSVNEFVPLLAVCADANMPAVLGVTVQLSPEFE